MDKLKQKGDEKITEPFDPTRIRITSQPMTIDLLLSRIKEGALELSPDFQRKGGIWSKEAQSRLIESLLIGIPLPTFYMDATSEDHWLVIDGLQRLTTLKRFVIDEKLRLRGLEFLTQFHDYTYSQLPARFKRRIRETQINVSKIEPGTPPNVKFNIFKRINTGGLPLSAQEIRHALNQGQATDFLMRLAQSDAFLRATARGISDTRMAARENVLRFVAFTLTPYHTYKAQNFDTFLNDTMAKMNQMPKWRLDELEQQFLRTMQAAHEIFGDYAFRKQYKRKSTKHPINKALFDSWSVNLNQLSDEQLETLKARKEQLTDKFIELMNHRIFKISMNKNSKLPHHVKLRFESIKRIIQEVIS